MVNVCLYRFSFFLFVCFSVKMSKSSINESTTNFQDASVANNLNSNSQTTTRDADIDKKGCHIDDECDAIGDLIGHYGKWQFVMTILLSLFQVPNTFHIFSPTFQVIKLYIYDDFFKMFYMPLSKFTYLLRIQYNIIIIIIIIYIIQLCLNLGRR